MRQALPSWGRGGPSRARGSGGRGINSTCPRDMYAGCRARKSRARATGRRWQCGWGDVAAWTALLAVVLTVGMAVAWLAERVTETVVTSIVLAVTGGGLLATHFRKRKQRR